MNNLYTKSLEIILKNQGEKGAFKASPAFSTYSFSWIRDGSFISHALDAAGCFSAAERFYMWVDEVINRYSYKLDTIIQKLDSGEKLLPSDFFNARYTMEGYDEEEAGWGNFQLDAYGTWLWALSEHLKLSRDITLLHKLSKSINISVSYIEKLWHYPNYDIWEENSDKIHTSTLACLYGGLKSINDFLKDEKVESLANKIRSYILTNCVVKNCFVKYIGTDEVDSSLIWIAVPFKVVDFKDELFVNTIKKIEEDLIHNGGIHRYKKDTYYGGGEWILLSAWAGWYYMKSGEVKKAQEILKWIESKADESGNLPEQDCTHVNNEVYYPYWVSRWGYPANPLLWSHAMYIVLIKELGGGDFENK